MKNSFSHVPESVFVSIELLSSSAGVSIADGGVTGRVLCEGGEGCGACEEEGGG